MRRLHPAQFHESMAHLPDDHPLKPNSAGSVQLPMFMTPNEVHASHQPLSGDKMERIDALEEDYHYGIDSQRSGDLWTTPIRGWRDDQETETSEQLWKRKAEESEESGLAESVWEHGVEYPVHLGMTPIDNAHKHPDEPRTRPEVVGGHHRISVAHPRQLMPVLFHDKSDIKPGALNMWRTGPSPISDIGAARNAPGYSYR